MALGKYEIVVGYDHSSTVNNVEDYFSHPPASDPLSDGAVRRVSIAGTERVDGDVVGEWRLGPVKYSELDAFITAIFTDWTGDNVEVTLGLRTTPTKYSQDSGESYYNAIIYRPKKGIDFQPINNTYVGGLRVRWRIEGVAS